MSCWRDQPDKRPSFAELVPVIGTLLEEIAGYMDFSILTTNVDLQSTNYDHLESRTSAKSENLEYDHLEQHLWNEIVFQDN